LLSEPIGLPRVMNFTSQSDVECNFGRGAAAKASQCAWSRLRIASSSPPGHDSVNEAIRTAIGKIRVGKAETLPIVEVVRQRKVYFQARPCLGPCLGWVGFGQNHLLGAE